METPGALLASLVPLGSLWRRGGGSSGFLWVLLPAPKAPTGLIHIPRELPCHPTPLFRTHVCSSNLIF